MAKTYLIEMSWLYKGRYGKGLTVREKGTTVRSAIGKALRKKREGWRESQGATIKIIATVLGNDLDSTREDNAECPAE